MKFKPTYFLSFFALILIGLFSITGCKSYQLGHPAELPFKTIFVKPAANESFAPQAQALITTKVREAVIRDGRVALATKESAADAVLLITLSDYKRKTGTRDQTDTEIAQDYDLTLETSISLYDQVADKYLIESRTIEARATAYTNNPYTPSGDPETQGLIQSEYQAMPRIAREIGRKIADEILSTW